MPKASLEEFEAANGPPNRMPCTVSTLLKDLEADRRESLLAALAAPRFQSAAIARVVTGWGHKVGDQTIARHRAGKCRCAR